MYVVNPWPAVPRGACKSRTSACQVTSNLSAAFNWPEAQLRNVNKYVARELLPRRAKSSRSHISLIDCVPTTQEPPTNPGASPPVLWNLSTPTPPNATLISLVPVIQRGSSASARARFRAHFCTKPAFQNRHVQREVEQCSPNSRDPVKCMCVCCCCASVLLAGSDSRPPCASVSTENGVGCETI